MIFFFKISVTVLKEETVISPIIFYILYSIPKEVIFMCLVKKVHFVLWNATSLQISREITMQQRKIKELSWWMR